jgi:alkylation response protein AidB-like acyl-CoA dehydrogenase
MKSTFYSADHELFRESVREYIDREVLPFQALWEAEHLIDDRPWTSAGKQGLLGIGVDERFGGGGQSDWRYRCVVMEELANVNATSLNSGFGLNEDVVMPYLADLATDEQKLRWLPRMVSGELITAIAMTEPGAGSDLQGARTTALRDGDCYVLNGSKTFITNGINADIVIVFARTDPSAGSRGFSLLVLEEGMEGFRRGRKLDKVGMHGQDTAELFFDDVRVPASNLLGTEGKGLRHLMERLPKERMSIAWWAQVAAEAALRWTVEYTKNRVAFGQPIIDYQNTRFALAEMTTEIEVTRSHMEGCVLALNAGQLSAVDAAKAKWWGSEMQKRVTDRCLQLFGGYGYMTEYPIGRAFIDSRVQTLYGGTTEIMKEIIGRDIATG